MSAKKSFFFKLSVVAVVFLMVMVVISSVLMSGQTATTHSTPWVDDWTHHHMVFSHPGSADEALAQGRIEHWSRTVNNPRYQLQVLKRSSTLASLAAAPDFAARMAILRSTNEIAIADKGRGRPPKGAPVEKDWSEGLGVGVAASQMGTFTASSGTGTVVVDGVTLTASPGTAASNSKITIASPFCFLAGGGVTVNGTAFTTNATQVNGTISFSGVGSAGETVVVAGITYDFHSSATGCIESATEVCVVRGAVNTDSAADLEAAINNNPSQCSAAGKTGGGGTTCFFDTVSSPPLPNPNVTATISSNIVTVAPRCAGQYSMTACGGGDCSVSATTVGSNGTTSGTNFAIGTNSATATNIYNDIKGNATTSAILTATNPSAGVVGFTAKVTGLVGNTYALATTATSGVTLVQPTNGAAGTTSGATFETSTDSTTPATNLANEAAALASAINANVSALTASSSAGVVTVTDKTAGSAGNSITLTGTLNATFSWGGGTLAGGASVNATVLPNAFPAEYGASLTSASCSDFVVFPTGVAGSSTQANIIAYNNLYTTGCPGAPSVLWAYNTHTGYTVTTSPVISLDGTQVAFIESSGGSSELVVLPTASGGGSVGSPAANPGTMSITGLSNHDTYSSPYYDNGADNAVYVGDDVGDLEQFTGVFTGTITGPTTVNLGSAPLSSAVYESNSGCVFVGDTTGFLYSANSGVAGSYCTGAFGANVVSANLGNAANGGIFDSPLVDGSAGSVYVFVTSSAAISSCTSGSNCVDQFPTNFGPGASPSNVAVLGTGGAGYSLFDGTFDNVYYSSATPDGNLYAVGNTGVTTGGNLYRVPIASNVLGTAVIAVGPINSSEPPWPSPLTEFLNGGTDYLFFSINRGTPSGCTNAAGNGCILSYNINTTSPSQSGSGLNVTTPGTNGCWATGGIVIDNSDSVTAGAQQIYFVNLNGATAAGTNSCTAGSASANATQASQSNP